MTPRTRIFAKSFVVLAALLILGIWGLGPALQPSGSQVQASPHPHMHNPGKTKPVVASKTTYRAGSQFEGDPYPLNTDPVAGTPLGPVGTQVVRLHGGRQLRFTSEANAQAFERDPARYLAGVDAQLVADQRPLYPLSSCPVSGEKLDGEMGQAFDFIFKNRLVRLCCENCKEPFKEDSAKYVASLDRAVIEQQLPGYKSKSCPVSGGALGSMGDPVDYVIGSRLVRFCCEGAPTRSCTESFAQNPFKYLAAIR